MLRTSLCVLTLSFAALSQGAAPVVDNDRVTEIAAPLQRLNRLTCLGLKHKNFVAIILLLTIGAPPQGTVKAMRPDRMAWRSRKPWSRVAGGPKQFDHPSKNPRADPPTFVPLRDSQHENLTGLQVAVTKGNEVRAVQTDASSDSAV